MAFHHQKGFSLIEIAMVMVIMGLMLAGLLIPLGQQREQLRIRDAKKQMADIEEAIYGFAAINNRLPCPSNGSAASMGQETPVTGGPCTSNFGFIPPVTLGLVGNPNYNNLLLDPWGNPYQYAVTNVAAFTTGGFTLATTGDLVVCDQASASALNCAAGNTLTSNAVAIIASLGKHMNDAQSVSPNQLENAGELMPKNLWTITVGTINYQYPQATDRVFVTRQASEVPAAEFDDLVQWISPNILFAKLIAAGKRPPP